MCGVGDLCENNTHAEPHRTSRAKLLVTRIFQKCHFFRKSNPFRGKTNKKKRIWWVVKRFELVFCIFAYVPTSTTADTWGTVGFGLFPGVIFVRTRTFSRDWLIDDIAILLIGYSIPHCYRIKLPTARGNIRTKI